MRFSKSIFYRRNMSNTRKSCGNYSARWIRTKILHCSANSNNTIGLHCSKNSNKSCLNETLITYLLTMRLNVPLGLFHRHYIYKQINIIPISARHSLRGRENEFETKNLPYQLANTQGILANTQGMNKIRRIFMNKWYLIDTWLIRDPPNNNIKQTLATWVYELWIGIYGNEYPWDTWLQILNTIEWTIEQSQRFY